jgi:hypothetical protein
MRRSVRRSGGTRTLRVVPSRSDSVTVALVVPSATVFTGTRSSRAWRATSSGGGPVVEYPSESSTMTAGGARRDLRPCCSSSSRRRRFSSITGRSAVSAESSAVPIAVPPSACSESSPSRTGCRSAVGGTSSCATFENETSPSLNFSGRRLVNPLAALRAASSRFGVTSVACMEPEESVVSMTVASSRATSTSMCGRAIAITSAASASRKSTGGRWRRHPGESVTTLPSSSRLVKRTA